MLGIDEFAFRKGATPFLQNDWDAVVNGLALNWSSGAVEGQVTRIKLIIRGRTATRTPGRR
ncbi:hypothetical protein [Kitasatospora sp. NPDC093806]|uniref:hypothetical protein n=1 Tax=Kitasatospora sp. NPDC093806 TaxID=3155075 RepID=UPI00342163C6